MFSGEEIKYLISEYFHGFFYFHTLKSFQTLFDVIRFGFPFCLTFYELLKCTWKQFLIYFKAFLYIVQK